MKPFKIILLNILILFAVAILFEGLNYVVYYFKTKETLELKNSAGFLQKLRYTKAQKFSTKNFEKYFTTNVYKNSEKRPILFLGCSYAQGIGLKNYETFAYKLSQKSQRTTYQRAISGGGIQLALHQFEVGEMKSAVPDAEYIIYVYLDYHISRLYSYQLDYIETEVNQRYKLSGKHLIKINQPIFPYYYSLFSVKNIQELIETVSSSKEYADFELFNAVMKELMSQAKKNYKDVKFAILLYPSANYIHSDNRDILPNYEIDKLKQMGFIVFDAEDMTELPIRSEKYRLNDKDHPNGKAWSAIVDGVVEHLHL